MADAAETPPLPAPGVAVSGAGRARPATVAILLDGQEMRLRAGRSLVAALWEAGIRVLRASPRAGAPRGAFCLMGSCQECVLRVNGRHRTACTEPVRAGMRVETGQVGR